MDREPREPAARGVHHDRAGWIHAHFGDCGTQAGDGNATVDRAQAQAAIVAASLALLDETA